MSYSLYYQAHVRPDICWMFVAILRSFEHLAFDRTYNVEQSIFEFLVPEESKEDFEYLMNYFENKNIIKNLKQLPNRFID